MKKLECAVLAAVLAFGANAADNVEETSTTVATTTTTSTTTETGNIFDGIYFGLGATIIDDGIKTWNSEENEIEDDHKAKLAGSAMLGYGKVINEKVYLGLEAGLDFAQHSEFNEREVIIAGLTPSASLRVGYVDSETRRMFYLKAGAAYSRAKLTPEHITDEFGNYRWSPIIAFGGEHICKNLRTRAEAEYRFSTKKSFSGLHEKQKKLHQL